MNALMERRFSRPQSFGSRRYTMNPNLLLSGLLSAFEAQFFRKEVKLELSPSPQGNILVDKELAESAMAMLLGRILNLAEKGSVLNLSWEEGKDCGEQALRLELDSSKPALAPLLPLNLAFSEQMRQGGIHYESEGSCGPWQFRFEGAF